MAGAASPSESLSPPLSHTLTLSYYNPSAPAALPMSTDFRWHMICYWIPGEYWSPGKICYWSPGKFLPALSALRHPAGPSSAAGPARLEIPANDDREWRQRYARRRPGRIRRIDQAQPGSRRCKKRSERQGTGEKTVMAAIRTVYAGIQIRTVSS